MDRYSEPIFYSVFQCLWDIWPRHPVSSLRSTRAAFQCWCWHGKVWPFNHTAWTHLCKPAVTCHGSWLRCLWNLRGNVNLPANTISYTDLLTRSANTAMCRHGVYTSNPKTKAQRDVFNYAYIFDLMIHVRKKIKAKTLNLKTTR